MRGDQYYLEYGTGIHIRWDSAGTWMVTIDDNLLTPHGSTDIVGLCGNFDGDPQSKYKIRWDESGWYKMRWDEMRWYEIRLDEIWKLYL